MVRTLRPRADDSSQQTHLLTAAAAAEWIVCGHVAGCQILAVATLIYHNAMPNGPVLVHIVFHVLENGLPTFAIPPPRAGAPCSVIKTLRDAIEATKRQLLCGAASRQSRRVLAGLAPSQAQKLNASAARPRRHRKVEKVCE